LTTGAAAGGGRLLRQSLGLTGEGQIEHLFRQDFPDFQEEVFDVSQVGAPRRAVGAVELIDKVFGNSLDVGPHLFH
jgi:hypothetical protein